MKQIILILISTLFLNANSDGIGLALGILGAIADNVDKIAEGVHEQDLSPKAQRLYKDCNDKNTTTSISSCDELSNMFSYGNGVPQSYEASSKFKIVAFESTMKNCENGNMKFCSNSVERYDNLPYNYKSSYYGNTAKILFAREKSCRAGMPKHCYSLGEIYENNKNYNKAIEFYNIGCDYAYEPSCGRLKALQ